ncbi:MAG TPA: hypothetical protein VGS98_13905, partial [Thermoanaerobaculia bacterium]|nr:hypothetical protein [Thermoanaerobaculia bacterium]
SDETDPDGTRTVSDRRIEMTGDTIVRRYPDGSQDDLPYDLTVTDDWDTVITSPCPLGGLIRTHSFISITDPNRYQGPETTPHIFDPYLPPDGTWGLQDPFSGSPNQFYYNRVFNYRDEQETTGCGGSSSDTNEFATAAFNILGFPGDLVGDAEGKTFTKHFETSAPGQPPLAIKWDVTVRIFTGRDLTVDRLEVTQGLQTTANLIPLVRGRRTVVRAYLGIGKEPGPVPGVSGILRGYAGQTPLGTLGAFNPGGQITAPDHPNWRNINDTLNFELPYAWTLQPSLRLVVKVNHFQGVLEDNYSNNENEISRPTRNCQEVDLGYASLHYDPPGGHVPADPGANISKGHEFLRKVYPVADKELKYSPLVGLTFSQDMTAEDAQTLLLRRLASRLFGSSAPRPDKIVGWLPQGAAGSDNGRVIHIPGSAAWVVQNLNPNYWRGTFAHEVAHAYGRHHTLQTTNGRHWFDVYERKIKPPRPGASDLRDVIYRYGHPEAERWVSPQTYSFLFNKFCSGAAAQTLEGKTATVGDNVLVTGTVNDVLPPTGSLDPLFRTSTAPTDIPPPPEAGPGYCLNLKNVAGTVLTQHCFDVTFEVESTTDDTAASAAFAMVVPYPVGLARVELTEGTDTLLAFRTPSASPPSVILTYPNAPGLTLAGVQTLTWTGMDPDADPLTYNLLYSADDGSTWMGVDALITGTSYALDFSQLPGGSAARIRVQASDGFHTAEDTSDNAFAVGSKGPAVAIVSPPTGETFNAALPVTLQGEGTDLEDGFLGDSALAWTSSEDGALGSGQLLEAFLSPGSHVITLTGADGDGLTATDTVALTVSGTPPPAPGFYTVTPCRVADTRDAAGPWGGPPLAAGLPRTFAIGGRCGVSPSAKAVSFNFTVTQPTAFGHLTVYPEGSNPPLVSAMNFRAGQTRANNAILALGPGGVLTVVSGQPSGTTHFIIDVNGYFE